VCASVRECPPKGTQLLAVSGVSADDERGRQLLKGGMHEDLPARSPNAYRRHLRARTSDGSRRSSSRDRYARLHRTYGRCVSGSCIFDPLCGEPGRRGCEHDVPAHAAGACSVRRCLLSRQPVRLQKRQTGQPRLLSARQALDRNAPRRSHLSIAAGDSRLTWASVPERRQSDYRGIGVLDQARIETERLLLRPMEAAD